MGFRSAQKEKSATEGLQKVEFREVGASDFKIDMMIQTVYRK